MVACTLHTLDDRDVDLLIHDLRGLLTTIQSWTALAQLQAERGLLPQEPLRGLSEACASGHALLQGYETDGPAATATELGGFFTRVERTLEHDFKRKGVILNIEQPALPMAVAANEGTLTIIAHNLLRNALEVCSRGARVQLFARANVDEHAVEICFSDSGPGIDDEKLQAIFERGASSHGHGRGLGLYAAATAAKRFGGSLRAEHSDTGGAAFVLTLPRAELPASKATDAPYSAQSIPARILLVEDDLATRRFMQTALEHDGHEVLEAASLQAARAQLSQAQVLVVDERLPDGSGPDLRRESNAPMIVVSGNPALGSEGGTQTLRKPFDVKVLCAMVREALAKSRPPSGF